jgi:hypothetical protein
MSVKKSTKRSTKRRSNWSKGPVPMLLALAGVLIVTAALVLRAQSNRQTEVFIPQANGGPKLSVDKETIDFGKVKMGKMVQASFKVTNLGDGDLRFLKAPYIEVVEGC